MRSRWNADDAPAKDPISQRVYTSRLIGEETQLVLHGGGNTSVKATTQDRFGAKRATLWVKASGFDLATMGTEGFTGIDLERTLRLGDLEQLSDSEMVDELLLARVDPHAATPSIEAIVHALIPFAYVDHTHADAIVTVSNTPGGRERLDRLFEGRCLILPYVKPGFDLARQFREVRLDLGNYDAVISEHHGLFTYADDARTSYETTIRLVSVAEDFLRNSGNSTADPSPGPLAPLTVARGRQAASALAGRAVVSVPVATIDPARVPVVSELLNSGPLTPEHVIHNKPFPAIVDETDESGFTRFAERYAAYFERGPDEGLTMLAPSPNWALYRSGHCRAYGPNLKRATVSADVARTTLSALRFAEQLGGWSGLTPDELHELEYWELEQAKLRRQPAPSVMTGRISVVTGAASGIGLACAETLLSSGSIVVGLDIAPAVETVVENSHYLGIRVDLTDEASTRDALALCVDSFGGIDAVVSNIGLFVTGDPVEYLEDATWDAAMEVNLNSHRKLFKQAIPFLRHGIEPSIVAVGSRNVNAPGAGAAAYSVSKAGLTQLTRVLALELAADRIRVNCVHPDAVFDTGLWTAEALETSARRYGLSVEEYKTRNLLGSEITSSDVAMAVVALLDGTLSKTTGCQLPVDGGNDRVI